MRNFTLTWEGNNWLINAFASLYRLKFIMRVSTACLVLTIITGCHFLQAEIVHGQTIENTYVDIAASNASLREIFSEIEKQTDFMFVFSPEAISKYVNVNIGIGRRSVKDLLEYVVKDSDLLYSERGNNIVISVDSQSNAILTQIKGKVVDKLGQPIAGVNIIVKGTTNGTATDANGQYTLDVRTGDWLVFSFIGYKTVEIQVGDQKDVDVSMEEDAQSLQEVVVGTSYYKMTDRRKTANIVKVSAKEISGQPLVSPLLSLQGRVAGLEVNPINGAAGAAPKIRIRGENSLRNNGGYPLYIVDGVIIDSSPLKSQSTVYFYGVDPLSSINPEDIESIEILKDADATAIYGSRGANGVVIVTTKRGKNSGGLSFDLTAYTGFGEIPNRVDLLDARQYLEMRREAFNNAGSTPTEYDYDLTQWDTTRNTNWQNVLLGGTSKISDLQGGFSGGNSTTSFRFGGGYHKETTFISDDFGYERTTGSFSFNHRSANQKIEISLSSNYGRTKNKSLNLISIVENAITLPPDAPMLYQEDGSLNWEIVDVGYKLSTFNNPMAELLKTNETDVSTLVTNGTISYMPMTGLIFKLNLGYTSSSSDEVVKNPISALPPTNIGASTSGSTLFSDNGRDSWLFEPQISYFKELNGGHEFDFLIGSTFQGSTNKWRAVEASGYASDVLLGTLKGATGYSFTFDDYDIYRYSALFARIGYNWRGKYLVNLTGRRDGSSRFGPGNKFGNFGAVGAAWIFSDEKFFKDKVSPILSFGKIRGSYGVTGNDQIGDYQYYNLYKIGDFTYQGMTTLKPNGLFNENFNWEVTKKMEASIELSFLKDRLAFQAVWYKNVSSNQLVNYQLPATTGFTSIFTNFDATVENRGLEFVFQSQNVSSRDFSWSTSFNISKPKNVLARFDNIENSPYNTQYKVGEPLSILYQYEWSGVNPESGLHEIVDLSGDGDITIDDRRFGKSISVEYYGGLLNTLRYRSIELSFLLQFSKQTAAGFYSYYPGMYAGNQPAQVLGRWVSEGDKTDVAKFSTDYALDDVYSKVVYSNYNVVDASFIKVKTLSISYRLPSVVLQKIGLGDFKIFGNCQNLLTFSSFIGLDPETGARGLPQMRMFTAGVQLKI